MSEKVNFVEQIIEFNKVVLGIEPRELGIMSEAEIDITAKSLIEEAEEFVEAHMDGNFLGTVDALLDSIYFAVGALYKSGLTAEQICESMSAVHHCNMDKKLGVNRKRGDGSAADAVKPVGWTAPEERISKILGDTWQS